MSPCRRDANDRSWRFADFEMWLARLAQRQRIVLLDRARVFATAVLADFAGDHLTRPTAPIAGSGRLKASLKLMEIHATHISSGNIHRPADAVVGGAGSRTQAFKTREGAQRPVATTLQTLHHDEVDALDQVAPFGPHLHAF